MKTQNTVKAYLSEIGRKGGSAKSERKAQAARINGAKHTGKKTELTPKPVGV